MSRILFLVESLPGIFYLFDLSHLAAIFTSPISISFVLSSFLLSNPTENFDGNPSGNGFKYFCINFLFMVKSRKLFNEPNSVPPDKSPTGGRRRKRRWRQQPAFFQNSKYPPYYYVLLFQVLHKYDNYSTINNSFT